MFLCYVPLPSRTAMLSLFSSRTAMFLRTTTFLPLYHVSYSRYLCYFMPLYPFTERYAQPYFFSCFDTVDAGRNPPLVTIHTWLERFNKQKPHSFEKATAPVDAKNWISHMEKIFDVMGCEDTFKTRLAVYKFEGNALAWWKAYKQAKGSDAWLVTVTWADFKKLFFLQFFPQAEQERLKREYHSIRQTNTET
nr:zinc finger, CCHC-type, retrotransposon Gag domain protein [Tanacetum cinerariifolium]